MTLYLTTLLKKMSLHEKSDNKVLSSEKKKKKSDDNNRTCDHYMKTYSVNHEVIETAIRLFVTANNTTIKSLSLFFPRLSPSPFSVRRKWLQSTASNSAST